MKAHLYCLILLAALAFVASCSEDDPVDPGDSISTYQPLTTREAVLNNIELAWTDRESGRIDELLDAGFVFFLSARDVAQGLPAYWSRADELQATTSLFNSSTGTTGLVLSSLHFDIQFDEVEWHPIHPPSAPTETWYTTTVPYTFTIVTEQGDRYIQPPGAEAQFTVREVDAGGSREWRLLEWRDFVDTVARALGSASTAQDTWGAFKALYRESKLVPLTTRNTVLTNIEAAYNERRVDAIDELLDDNFTFFFDAGDVGGEIPARWSRADEFNATSRWFLSNAQSDPPADPVCTSILVDLSFNPSTIAWVEVIPEAFPTETWFMATVFYVCTFEFEPDDTYIATPGAKAQFTVRYIETARGIEWRLVEWRDLGDSLLSGPSLSAQLSESTTWGRVKALYR